MFTSVYFRIQFYPIGRHILDQEHIIFIGRHTLDQEHIIFIIMFTPLMLPY